MAVYNRTPEYIQIASQPERMHMMTKPGDWCLSHLPISGRLHGVGVHRYAPLLLRSLTCYFLNISFTSSIRVFDIASLRRRILKEEVAGSV